MKKAEQAMPQTGHANRFIELQRPSRVNRLLAISRGEFVRQAVQKGWVRPHSEYVFAANLQRPDA